jgi:hypothetical protein
MAAKLHVDLTAEQRQQLVSIRDRHPKPYVRERAAAILKIADGSSGLSVAAHGLLRSHKQETIYAWFHRYIDEGTAGLLVRAGRGRKPAFFP